ncbi:MAG: hypothetical protein ACKERG_02350 [Candidatus Hodgkinia cicadicola]
MSKLDRSAFRTAVAKLVAWDRLSLGFSICESKTVWAKVEVGASLAQKYPFSDLLSPSLSKRCPRRCGRSSAAATVLDDSAGLSRVIISVKSRLRAAETVPLVEVGTLSCDEKCESLSSSVVKQQTQLPQQKRHGQPFFCWWCWVSKL